MTRLTMSDESNELTRVRHGQSVFDKCRARARVRNVPNTDTDRCGQRLCFIVPQMPRASGGSIKNYIYNIYVSVYWMVLYFMEHGLNLSISIGIS